MLVQQSQLSDLAVELSAMRLIERKDAEHSIRIKDHFSYADHEFMYHQLDSLLVRFFDHKDDEAFPEWPYDFIFVDPAEFEYTPVVFSDGSTIDDTVDVPF